MTGLRSRIAAGLLGALARTWRIDVTGGEHLAAVRGQGPFLFALWHRTLLPLLWWHRAERVTLLVSRHADGALVADAAGELGYGVVRGSSTRGGVAGLRGVLRVLAAGAPVAVTPDGPRGPSGVVKPGVVAAARQSGAPILPVTAAADRAWHARSWDGFAVPKPFARVRVAYGSPWHPPADETAACEELADRLEHLTRTAASAWRPA